MKIIDQIKTANHNLRRSILRTTLTVLAIVIGAFTFAMSLGLGEGIRGYISSQIGAYENANLYRVVRIGAESFSTGFTSPDPKEYKPESEKAVTDFSQLIITADELRAIESLSSVLEVHRPYSATVEYITGADGVKYAAPGDISLPELQKTMLAGRILQDKEIGSIVLSNKYLSVVGAEKAEQAIGKKLPVSIKLADNSIRTYDLEIVGVMAPSIFDQALSYTEAQAREFAVVQRGALSESFGSLFVSKKPNATDAELKDAFKSIGFDASSIKDGVSTLNSIITGAQVGLGAFSGIAILAAIVGLVNTLFMAVLERTKEIGLFRALGAKRRTVFSLFSIEAALIGFWGSIVGLLLANGAALAINAIASNTFLKGVDGYRLLDLPLNLHILIVVAVMSVTLLAGLLPAYKASKLDPIEALRYE